MEYIEAFKKLSEIGQEHLLKYFEGCSKEQKETLLNQVKELSLSTILKQREALKKHRSSSKDLSPLKNPVHVDDIKDASLGKEYLRQGKVGCLLAAGGQGSRLRFDEPKGMYPVSNVKNKTLFQLFAEKTYYASQAYEFPLSLAIMTSPLHHDTVQTYFEEKKRFQLSRDQLSLYPQKTLPLLDHDGNMFLESKGKIAEGPDGNGNALKEFYEQGIWKKWKEKGIELVTFLQVDNALADPFDERFISFHLENNADVNIKSIIKNRPEEKVGTLVKIDDRIHVIEYSEFPHEKAKEKKADGSLAFSHSNISLFCFSMRFIEEIAKNTDIPLHPAHKAVKYLDNTKKTILPEQANAWKFERFIFDVLPSAENAYTLAYDREKCFSPLKNLSGTKDIHSVQASLLENDKRIFEKISHTKIDVETHFELSQAFHYPTQNLRNKWKNKPLPKEGGYI